MIYARLINETNPERSCTIVRGFVVKRENPSRLNLPEYP
jgi:hypothetical protein